MITVDFAFECVFSSIRYEFAFWPCFLHHIILSLFDTVCVGVYFPDESNFPAFSNVFSRRPSFRVCVGVYFPDESKYPRIFCKPHANTSRNTIKIQTWPDASGKHGQHANSSETVGKTQPRCKPDPNTRENTIKIQTRSLLSEKHNQNANWKTFGKTRPRCKPDPNTRENTIKMQKCEPSIPQKKWKMKPDRFTCWRGSNNISFGSFLSHGSSGILLAHQKEKRTEQKHVFFQLSEILFASWSCFPESLSRGCTLIVFSHGFWSGLHLGCVPDRVFSRVWIRVVSWLCFLEDFVGFASSRSFLDVPEAMDSDGKKLFKMSN